MEGERQRENERWKEKMKDWRGEQERDKEICNVIKEEREKDLEKNEEKGSI